MLIAILIILVIVFIFDCYAIVNAILQKDLPLFVLLVFFGFVMIYFIIMVLLSIITPQSNTF